MKLTPFKLLLFIALIAISNNGLSQRPVLIPENQNSESVVRKDGVRKGSRQQKANVLASVRNYEMKYIAGGTFSMGSPINEPNRKNNENQYSVTVSSFYMGATEVTQALWKAVMGTSDKLNNPSYFKGDNLPVENVSWDDCMKFIKKLNQFTGKNYRLPTEAEWEYACRAGTTTPYSTGNKLTTEQANYDGNTEGQNREMTMSVGSFAPNAWGLYDMHGNVWEWCSDWYGDYPTVAQTNPVGLRIGAHKVCRGGSWSYIHMHCRSAFRFCSDTGRRFNDLGFRLVHSL